MASRGQTVFAPAPEGGPLHFPHLGAFVGVFDAIPLPRLFSEYGRMLGQVANLARVITCGQTRIVFGAATPAVFRPVVQYFRLSHPALEVDGNLGHKHLSAFLQGIEELAVAAVQLVACPSRNAHSIG